MSSVEEKIEIPTGVLVACPKVKFALVRVASACVGCPKFDGLDDRFPGGGQAFELRYTVRCFAEPVKRQLARMVEEAE